MRAENAYFRFTAAIVHVGRRALYPVAEKEAERSETSEFNIGEGVT